MSFKRILYIDSISKINNDVNSVVEYSNRREDEDRQVQHMSESYAQASAKLRGYIHNPYPNKRIAYLICAIGILFCGALGMAIWLFKRYHRTVQKHEKQKVNRCEVFAKRVYNHSIYFMDPKIWDNNKDLRKLANTYVGDIFTRLEDTYHLNEREIKICLMILLEYSREQIAHILLVQPNTISKTKNKIAKDLNTTSAQLRDFLIDFLSF